jgi:hypothetical protein
MKLRLCYEILKNFGRLLSFDFWRLGITNPDFPTFQFVKMILVLAFVDIVKMIICPGYPEKAEATE